MKMLWLPVFFCLACSPKMYNMNSLPKEYVIMSNGGGFTGAELQYYILPNGQVFSKNTWRDTMPKTLEKLPKKAVNNILNFLKSKRNEQMTLNEPDNIYKSFTLVNGDSSNYWVWYQVTEKSTQFEEQYRLLIEVFEKVEK